MKNDATTRHLVELLKWATGPDHTGNPYGHKAVRDALSHLGELTGGNDWATALDEARDLLAVGRMADEVADRVLSAKIGPNGTSTQSLPLCEKTTTGIGIGIGRRSRPPSHS